MKIRRGLIQKYASIFMLLLRSYDAIVPFIAGYLAYVGTYGQLTLPPEIMVALLVAVLLVIVSFPRFFLYQVWRGSFLWKELRQVSVAWTVAFLGVLFLNFFVLKTDYSRLWFLCWFASSWSLLVLFRIGLRLFQRWARQNGYNVRSVMIAGAGKLGKELAEHIQETPWLGFKVVAFFDDNPDLRGKTINGVPVLGNLSEVSPFLDQQFANQLWITLPFRAESKIKCLVEDLRHHTVEIRFVPDIFGFELLNHSFSDLAGVPIINLSASPMEHGRVIKEIEDRVLAAIILTLISPLLLFIALGVKLSSPGPVLFRQKRLGWNNQPIEVWKFRSMVCHEELPGMVTQAKLNDPPNTRFGRFLRGTSLDELPQFFNVLQGRMSIVGPRPHALEHNESYKEIVSQYMKRHKVKPGITGWAQINGWRGETKRLEKMQKRVKYDLYYIQNWSIWFDIKIIVFTVWKGFFNEELKGVFSGSQTGDGFSGEDLQYKPILNSDIHKVSQISGQFVHLTEKEFLLQKSVENTVLESSKSSFG